jgi:phospholipid/cholesterol/gamma-HCH transport system substrate-binding protein
MERQANYALVGIVSIVLIIAALVFVVWLAQFQFNQTYDDYRIIFRGPVSGLSKGGEVQFNGIKFGEITDIKLDEHDPNRVITKIELDHGTPVRVDSIARTAAKGITGVRFVQISAGSVEQPLLRQISRERAPVIRAESARFDALVEDVSRLTRDGADAVARLNRLLSDKNIATISRSVDNIGLVTDELSARRLMFAKLDRAAGDLEQAASTARNSLGGVNGTLAQINQSAAVLRQTLVGVRSLVERVDGSVSDVSSTTLPELHATLVSIQRTSDSLNELSSEIRRDPRGTLLRSKGQEVEIKP